MFCCSLRDHTIYTFWRWHYERLWMSQLFILNWDNHLRATPGPRRGVYLDQQPWSQNSPKSIVFPESETWWLENFRGWWLCYYVKLSGCKWQKDHQHQSPWFKKHVTVECSGPTTNFGDALVTYVFNVTRWFPIFCPVVFVQDDDGIFLQQCLTEPCPCIMLKCYFDK